MWAPRFVAPHTMLQLLLPDPSVVASLFVRNPFPDAPPAMVRVSAYRHRFTALPTGPTTGTWWSRTLDGSEPRCREREAIDLTSHDPLGRLARWARPPSASI